MSFVDNEARNPDYEESRPRSPVIVSPRPDPQGHFKRMLEAIPASAEEAREGSPLDDASDGIALAARINAAKASEARRDAILAVALAIKRRGGNPLTDWTTRDTDTAYAIADQLRALS